LCVCLQGLLGGRDWNAQDEMAEVNALLVDLGRKVVPTSVITHSPKDPRLHRAAGTITQEANHATVLHIQKQMVKAGPGAGKDLLTISVDSKLYPVPQFELLINSEPAPTPDNPDARKLVSVSLASENVSAAIPKSAKVEAEPDKRQKIVDYLAEHPEATVQEIADSVPCSYEYARRMRKDIIDDAREAEDGRVFGTGGGTIQ
jgi:hypothetical protein